MENSKKIIFFLIIAAIVAGGYYLFFSDRNAEEGQQTAKQEKVSRGDVIVRELADKYQATTGWEENLTYTLQAQERLITGKPTLFRGYVDDVFSRDGKTFVRFSSSFLSPVDYVLELECGKETIAPLLSQKQDDKMYLRFFDEYAVVANIREISKPVFALEGSAISEDEVEVDIESSGLFTGKGTCLELVHIGDDE